MPYLFHIIGKPAGHVSINVPRWEATVTSQVLDQAEAIQQMRAVARAVFLEQLDELVPRLAKDGVTVPDRWHLEVRWTPLSEA